MPDSDAALQRRIDAAKTLSLEWLTTMQAHDRPEGVSRISAFQDIDSWPGMLLPGTHNSILCRALLGDLESMSPSALSALAEWMTAFRLEDGRFRIPEMREEQIFQRETPEESWRYVDFNVTNYTLGALEFIAPGSRPELRFAHPWLDVLFLKAWLAERDLRIPWKEGNNIVNLGSFLLLLRRCGDRAMRQKADAVLPEILQWHYRLQEPATGFWGVGQSADPKLALHAMAGSMHNFHLWYALDEKLPYQDKAVDYALSLKPGIFSACIAVDLADLLVHAHMLMDYRRGEIEQWLRTLLDGLLSFQNGDGGFPDRTEKTWIQHGWLKGYSEPQGISNVFATYFRWITIAMIAECLWPGWRRWRFRTIIGIGYKRPLKAS